MNSLSCKNIWVFYLYPRIKKRVEISGFEMDNSVVYEYVNKLPATDRDSKLLKAIYIGVLALMEDRISSFFAKTSNELGTELESLKMLFEMKQDIFFKTSVKGVNPGKWRLSTSRKITDCFVFSQRTA